MLTPIAPQQLSPIQLSYKLPTSQQQSIQEEECQNQVETGVNQQQSDERFIVKSSKEGFTTINGVALNNNCSQRFHEGDQHNSTVTLTRSKHENDTTTNEDSMQIFQPKAARISQIGFADSATVHRENESNENSCHHRGTSGGDLIAIHENIQSCKRSIQCLTEQRVNEQQRDHDLNVPSPPLLSQNGDDRAKSCSLVDELDEEENDENDANDEIVQSSKYFNESKTAERLKENKSKSIIVKNRKNTKTVISNRRTVNKSAKQLNEDISEHLSTTSQYLSQYQRDQQYHNQEQLDHQQPEQIKQQSLLSPDFYITSTQIVPLSQNNKKNAHSRNGNGRPGFRLKKSTTTPVINNKKITSLKDQLISLNTDTGFNKDLKEENNCQKGNKGQDDDAFVYIKKGTQMITAKDSQMLISNKNNVCSSLNPQEVTRNHIEKALSTQAYQGQRYRLRRSQQQNQRSVSNQTHTAGFNTSQQNNSLSKKRKIHFGSTQSRFSTESNPQNQYLTVTSPMNIVHLASPSPPQQNEKTTGVASQTEQKSDDDQINIIIQPEKVKRVNKDAKPVENDTAHYKLNTKGPESYSKRGFGIGFASKTQRFFQNSAETLNNNTQKTTSQIKKMQDQDRQKLYQKDPVKGVKMIKAQQQTDLLDKAKKLPPTLEFVKDDIEEAEDNSENRQKEQQPYSDISLIGKTQIIDETLTHNNVTALLDVPPAKSQIDHQTTKQQLSCASARQQYTPSRTAQKYPQRQFSQNSFNSRGNSILNCAGTQKLSGKILNSPDKSASLLNLSAERLLQKHHMIYNCQTWEHMRKLSQIRKDICSPVLQQDCELIEQQRAIEEQITNVYLDASNGIPISDQIYSNAGVTQQEVNDDYCDTKSTLYKCDRTNKNKRNRSIQPIKHNSKAQNDFSFISHRQLQAVNKSDAIIAQNSQVTSKGAENKENVADDRKHMILFEDCKTQDSAMVIGGLKILQKSSVNRPRKSISQACQTDTLTKNTETSRSKEIVYESVVQESAVADCTPILQMDIEHKTDQGKKKVVSPGPGHYDHHFNDMAVKLNRKSKSRKLLHKMYSNKTVFTASDPSAANNQSSQFMNAIQQKLQQLEQSQLQNPRRNDKVANVGRGKGGALIKSHSMQIPQLTNQMTTNQTVLINQSNELSSQVNSSVNHGMCSRNLNDTLTSTTNITTTKAPAAAALLSKTMAQSSSSFIKSQSKPSAYLSRTAATMSLSQRRYAGGKNTTLAQTFTSLNQSNKGSNQLMLKGTSSKINLNQQSSQTSGINFFKPSYNAKNTTTVLNHNLVKQHNKMRMLRKEQNLMSTTTCCSETQTSNRKQLSNRKSPQQNSSQIKSKNKKHRQIYLEIVKQHPQASLLSQPIEKDKANHQILAASSTSVDQQNHIISTTNDYEFQNDTKNQEHLVDNEVKVEDDEEDANDSVKDQQKIADEKYKLDKSGAKSDDKQNDQNDSQDEHEPLLVIKLPRPEEDANSNINQLHQNLAQNDSAELLNYHQNNHTDANKQILYDQNSGIFNFNPSQKTTTNLATAGGTYQPNTTKQKHKKDTKTKTKGKKQQQVQAPQLEGCKVIKVNNTKQQGVNGNNGNTTMRNQSMIKKGLVLSPKATFNMQGGAFCTQQPSFGQFHEQTQLSGMMRIGEIGTTKFIQSKQQQKYKRNAAGQESNLVRRRQYSIDIQQQSLINTAQQARTGRNQRDDHTWQQFSFQSNTVSSMYLSKGGQTQKVTESVQFNSGNNTNNFKSIYFDKTGANKNDADNTGDQDFAGQAAFAAKNQKQGIMQRQKTFQFGLNKQSTFNSGVEDQDQILEEQEQQPSLIQILECHGDQQENDEYRGRTIQLNSQSDDYNSTINLSPTNLHYNCDEIQQTQPTPLQPYQQRCFSEEPSTQTPIAAVNNTTSNAKAIIQATPILIMGDERMHNNQIISVTDRKTNQHQTYKSNK